MGKTYEMLEAAQTLAIKGSNVLIGYVEPHGRPETEALLLGLDILPDRIVEYRGIKLHEFDLDAALKAHPTLIVVDELAHTNAPGSRHVKRWQDVEELLEAGIDVYTTVNVQHVESLNDVVAQITGIAVQETLPDTVFDMADEIRIVDLSPDDLLERLREGKVYVPAQVERAVQSFFRKPNLIALRELAMRRTADQINRQTQQKTALEPKPVKAWPTTERLLVCVGPSPTSATVIRAAKRLSLSLRADWIAASVETPHTADMSEKSRQQFLRNLKLAEQLGAETVTLSGERVADEILAYAASRHVTKIVVGKTNEPWWLFPRLHRQQGDPPQRRRRCLRHSRRRGAVRDAGPRRSPAAQLGRSALCVAHDRGRDGFQLWPVVPRPAGDEPGHGVHARRRVRGGPVRAKPGDLGLRGGGPGVRFLLRPAVWDVCRERHPVLHHLRRDAGHRAASSAV